MWRTFLIAVIIWGAMASQGAAQIEFPTIPEIEIPEELDTVAVINGYTSQSERFRATHGANQAAGTELLSRLWLGTTHVDSWLTDRHVAFLLTGDVSISDTDFGIPPTGVEALKIPAVPDDEANRKVAVRGPDLPSANRWTSLRVYDRGACSFRAGWQTLTEELFQGYVDELNEDPGVRGAVIEHGELEPRLRSSYDTNVWGRRSERPKTSINCYWTFV